MIFDDFVRLIVYSLHVKYIILVIDTYIYIIITPPPCAHTHEL